MDPDEDLAFAWHRLLDVFDADDVRPAISIPNGRLHDSSFGYWPAVLVSATVRLETSMMTATGTRSGVHRHWA